MTLSNFPDNTKSNTNKTKYKSNNTLNIVSLPVSITILTVIYLVFIVYMCYSFK